MKIQCPICGIEGFVQVRGRNVMIQHYVGYKDGKRLYKYHRIPYETLELQVNASKEMRVKKLKTGSELEFDNRAGRLARLGHLLVAQVSKILKQQSRR